MVPNEEYKRIQADPKMTEKEKSKFISKQQDFILRSQVVNENAGLFVEYFTKRVENFIEHVLKPLWGVIDYWVRYEYQGEYRFLVFLCYKFLLTSMFVIKD